jgi:hypothetical protein
LGSWYEFNDSVTKPFEFSRNFEEECFGKTSSSSTNITGPATMLGDSGWATDDWGTAIGASSKSAYVLIYEKRIKSNIKVLVDKEEIKKIYKTPEDIKKEKENEK